MNIQELDLGFSLKDVVRSDYFNGEVYLVVLEDETGDCLDSLSGIYGLEYAESEAKQMLLGA
ncbi:hypothetical protein [Helicobacter sp. 11S03491-1]|uniref:hypothetical protein n=1 Tax=Helicobacter sp. 11S03491-1 TaxID=1476196 RepID=UPI000BA5AD42|nr:hypothetical protein [Helicobacter sp. 11S03491-1]PAF41050.1 hypothetical protein BKH45_08560 [Helicobacter sp. 11S03491-1]